MALNLSEDDHRALKRLLDNILTLHADGEVTILQARELLVQVFTAAALDNAEELRDWLNNPNRFANWRRDVDAARP